MNTFKTIGFGFLGGLLSIALYLTLLESDSLHKTSTAALPIPSTRISMDFEPKGSEPRDFTRAAEMSVHSVVHIKTTIKQQVNNAFYFNPFFEFFYGQQGMQPSYQTQVSAGSGVLVRKDGYIITNHHVIQNATSIEVTLNNKKSYTAKLIGSDAAMDLALLKIEGDNFPVVTITNSDLAKVGEWVLAVGNPFNLTSTVTAGIISAKGRDIDILENDYNSGTPALEAFIQTDAAVNPGNSGGALVNMSGELIGINTAIKSNTGSYAGYAFAIPSNLVAKVIEDFIEYGKVQRGFLGISWMDLSPELADKLSVPELKGVYVHSVTKGSSAEMAGIEAEDVILSVNNKEVQNVTSLQALLATYRPGDEVNLDILRNKNMLQKKVVLQNQFGSTRTSALNNQHYISDLSVYLEDVSSDEIPLKGFLGGVRVSSLKNGLFRQLGIREGYIILKVNQQDVKSTSEFIHRFNALKGGVLLEGVYPDGTVKPYAFGK